MDELSAFRGAPSEMRSREEELLRKADVVFTGGRSLYEAKRDRHPNVHLFPSSVDLDHFGAARGLIADPPDQAGILRPRLGFFGVIDERMDFELLAGIAAARPDWQLVLVGPTAKIEESALPTAPNIHYLGGKSYDELPLYLSGWDVALIPFALNDATRYISPTKVPEYLAAGRPVVSTPIRDVVRPYATAGAVRIGETAADFVVACEAAMAEDPDARQARVDPLLSAMSWDRTWAEMRRLIEETVAEHVTSGARLGAGSLLQTGGAS
jgi:UDP-galactopyranose mutase